MIVPGRLTGVTVVLSRGSDRATLTFSGTIKDLGPLVDDDLPGTRPGTSTSVPFFLQDGLLPDLPDLFGKARAGGDDPPIDPNPGSGGGVGRRVPFRCSEVDRWFLPNAMEALSLARLDDPGSCGFDRRRADAHSWSSSGEGGGSPRSASETSLGAGLYYVTSPIPPARGTASTRVSARGSLRANPLRASRPRVGTVVCGSLSTLGTGGGSRSRPWSRCWRRSAPTPAPRRDRLRGGEPLHRQAFECRAAEPGAIHRPTSGSSRRPVAKG